MEFLPFASLLAVLAISHGSHSMDECMSECHVWKPDFTKACVALLRHNSRHAAAACIKRTYEDEQMSLADSLSECMVVEADFILACVRKIKDAALNHPLRAAAVCLYQHRYSKDKKTHRRRY